MPTDKKGWIEPLLLVILTAIVTYMLVPKKSDTVVVHVPHIVTVHDTTKVPVPFPVLSKPGKATTDTINLVTKTVVHDTVQVPVNNVDTSKVSPLWPVISLTAGAQTADTTHTTTISLRSGKLTESFLWTPGPLLGVWADSSGMPRIQYGTWPTPQMPLVSKLKWAGIGAGALAIVVVILRGF